MRRLLICACALALPCTGWAQSGQSATSWENLAALQAGEKIQVVDLSHKKHSGAFVSFSDQAVTIEEKSEEKTIQRSDVASVNVSARHRLRNAMIGGAIGGGAGAGIGAGACWNGTFVQTRGICAGFFGVAGFVGGAVVGALLHGNKTIYRANP